MTNAKPIITKFRWHQRYLALDWQVMKFAFVINRLHGDAKLLIPSQDTDKPGVQAAIPVHRIHKFTVRQGPEIELMLEVKYKPSKKCLGISKQIDEAKKWVSDANKLINNVQKRKST